MRLRAALVIAIVIAGTAPGLAAPASPAPAAPSAAMVDGVIRALLGAFVAESVPDAPASERDGVVGCIMDEMAIMSPADRLMLAQRRFELTRTEAAQIERDYPGLEARVLACQPHEARAPSVTA